MIGFQSPRPTLSAPGGFAMTDTLLEPLSPRSFALFLIKIAHTAIWAFFAACILALPVAGWLRRFDGAMILTVFILIECGVLAANRMRCPLTDLAARYTTDRSHNFDIYLPLWLAKHNKSVFGTLFVLNDLIVLWEWLG
jgi:hypothetical protein